ncbi:MAG: hypothetical protein HY556_00590 [Euryarchaeota archaeon]|nr:hypothetical protein [Euryarchaeota archaeon]
MDRTRVGFAIVGVAPLLWVAVNVMRGAFETRLMLALLIGAVGAFVAAWRHPERPTVAAAGLGAVALSILLFYDRGIFLTGIASVAGGLVAVGAAVTAVGLARSTRRLRLGGAVVAAFGALVWIATDDLAWQPGNVAAAIGWIVVAAEAR